jgi:hypothetical protein
MTAKPRNSKDKERIKNLEAELKAEKNRGANFHFTGAELDMIRWLCSEKEESLKFFEEGGIDEFHSISKKYKDQLIGTVRNIYHKITFK